MQIGDLPAYAALLAALAAGTVSFLSPCVAPLVPGYVAFVAGEDAERARTLRRTLAFVAGFATVFTLLGLTAASLSQTVLRHRAELELVAGSIVAMLGLAMVWGRTPFGTGGSAGRITTRLREPGGYVGAGLVGAAFAIAWSPCIGPVLASILALAAGGGDAAWGGLLLLTYSAGLGIPFLLVGVGLDRARRWSRALRQHSRAIQVASGGLMIAMGVLIAAGVLGKLTARLATMMPGLL